MTSVSFDFRLAQGDLEKIIEELKCLPWGLRKSAVDITTSFEKSLCCVARKDNQLIGFARVVTDEVFIAYIADFVIVDAERAKGVGSDLLRAVFAHPSLINVQSWLLISEDQGHFFEKHGFKRQLERKFYSAKCTVIR